MSMICPTTTGVGWMVLSWGGVAGIIGWLSGFVCDGIFVTVMRDMREVNKGRRNQTPGKKQEGWCLKNSTWKRRHKVNIAWLQTLTCNNWHLLWLIHSQWGGDVWDESVMCKSNPNNMGQTLPPLKASFLGKTQSSTNLTCCQETDLLKIYTHVNKTIWHGNMDNKTSTFKVQHN